MPEDLGTLAVHGGEPRKKAHDSVTTPLVLAATYVFEDTAEIERYFRGEIDREEYGRYGNPTVRAAEQKLAALEGAEEAALHKALRPGRTKVILAESPTNPYLRVADLAQLARARNACPGANLIVDATFATPINQRPLTQGVDLVVHSATKFLGGHNDLLAGAALGRAGLVQSIKDLRGVLGGVLDAHSAFLLIRGLKTLPLRVRRQNETALAVARWLEEQPKVRRVFYPGLPSHPDHAAALKQMSGFGGVVSFRLQADAAGTSKFVDACKLATIAPSLGATETLIEQPALMSYFELTTEEREAIGIFDDLVRLSVGLENAADVIADLQQALQGI